MASCQRCERTDLKLTQNGRLRSHAANGKRASADNPHCPGGSDWPLEHVRALAAQGDAGAMADLVARGEDPSGDGSVDNRPTAEDVEAAEKVMAAPGAPDDVFSHAEEVLRMASTFGIRSSTLVHRFESGPTGPNPHRAPLSVADMRTTDGIGFTADVAMAGDGSWTQQPSSPEGTTRDRTSGQSSTPGTTVSAPIAPNRSMKGTSSGRPTESSFTPSARRNGSVGSDAADTPATPVKTPNEATAFLSSPNPVGGGPGLAVSNDVPRDRWGRYLIAHPESGRVQPWTRTTTVASSIADTFALSQWSQRMAVKGITMRPDLYALASGYDVAADKDDLNSVCEQAKTAAGDKVAANLGTAMHAFTAGVDRGMEMNIPPSMVDDVNAYSVALRAYGFELVTDMIERRVVLTKKTAGEDIAGTFDRVYRATRDVDIKLADGKIVHTAAGTHLIGDLKTGRDLAYAWGEIAIQEAIYAHAINENGVWDSDAKEWIPDPLHGAGVSEHIGIVVHLPIQKEPGAPACVMYAVDLEQGWDAIQLCVQVRQWRKAKKIATALDVVDQTPRPAAVRAPLTRDEIYPGTDADAADRKQAHAATWASNEARVAAMDAADDNGRTPSHGFRRPTSNQMADYPSVKGETAVQPVLAIDTPPAARPPTWEERAGAVSTKAEASAIYQEMRPKVQTIGQNRFNEIVKLMQTRLNSLVEQGG